jgi:hypothetical protein
MNKVDAISKAEEPIAAGCACVRGSKVEVCKLLRLMQPCQRQHLVRGDGTLASGIEPEGPGPGAHVRQVLGGQGRVERGEGEARLQDTARHGILATVDGRMLALPGVQRAAALNHAQTDGICHEHEAIDSWARARRRDVLPEWGAARLAHGDFRRV